MTMTTPPEPTAAAALRNARTVTPVTMLAVAAMVAVSALVILTDGPTLAVAASLPGS